MSGIEPQFSSTPGDAIAVTVRVVPSPDGRARVLLQLPDGFVLLTAGPARDIAGRLIVCADELADG
jgi:hypothetical protein